MFRFQYSTSKGPLPQKRFYCPKYCKNSSSKLFSGLWAAVSHKFFKPSAAPGNSLPTVALSACLAAANIPCRGFVAASTADFLIDAILIIYRIGSCGLMDARFLVGSGLVFADLLNVDTHFAALCTLAAPGRDRLCLLQDRFRRGNCRFFQWVIVIAFCIRKAHQAKGSGPKPWPAGSGRSFSWKSTSFLSVRWFLFLGEFSLALLYHTVIIFFNYYLVFCAHLHFLSLASKGWLLWFLPCRGRGPNLHPDLSNFYQNAVEGRFRLIFPCF